jgi:hypothetical protein
LSYGNTIPFSRTLIFQAVRAVFIEAFTIEAFTIEASTMASTEAYSVPG